jgi:hypothetical protein
MPIACITGDVHHYLGHHAVERDEHRFAAEYVQLLTRHSMKVTLFVTGKCISQHRDFWHELSTDGQIELGAHTYSAFKDPFYPPLAFFSRALMNIPWFDRIKDSMISLWRLYYYLDVKKTVHAFESIGIKPKAWRTHSYKGRPELYQILEKIGFNVISDIREKRLIFVRNGKLLAIPITEPPDDDIASFYFKGKIEQMKREGEKLRVSVFESMRKKRNLVVQLHPLHMKLLDNFETLIAITNELDRSGYCTLTMSELAKVSIEFVGKTEPKGFPPSENKTRRLFDERH